MRNSNVYEFKLPAVVSDPLADERILQALANFLTLGSVHPEGRTTTFVEEMSDKDRKDFGVMSPLLFARVPAGLGSSTPIYRLFYQDARIPRIAQIVASSWLHRREMHWSTLKKMMGRPSHAHRMSVRHALDILVDNDCVVECDDGQLIPSRRLLYYILETVCWMADRLTTFFEDSGPVLASAWDDDGGTNWVDIQLKLTARTLRK